MPVSKETMNKIKIKPVIISMTIPFALDGIATLLALYGMVAGSINFDSLISIVFKLANWPSILFKISPFDQKEPALLDSFNIKVLVFNVVGWGLMGILYSCILKKRSEILNENQQ